MHEGWRCSGQETILTTTGVVKKIIQKPFQAALWERAKNKHVQQLSMQVHGLTTQLKSFELNIGPLRLLSNTTNVQKLAVRGRKQFAQQRKWEKKKKKKGYGTPQERAKNKRPQQLSRAANGVKSTTLSEALAEGGSLLVHSLSPAETTHSLAAADDAQMSSLAQNSSWRLSASP